MYSGCGEMMQNYISHFCRAETASPSSKNRCAPKISKTILKLLVKVRKVRKILYAAAGISQYGLFSVAHIIGDIIKVM